MKKIRRPTPSALDTERNRRAHESLQSLSQDMGSQPVPLEVLMNKVDYATEAEVVDVFAPKWAKLKVGGFILRNSCFYPTAATWRRSVIYHLLIHHGGSVLKSEVATACAIDETSKEIYNVIYGLEDVEVDGSFIRRVQYAGRKLKSRCGDDKSKKQAIGQSAKRLILGDVSEPPLAIAAKLGCLWSKPEHVIVIDAGSTNIEVALAISSVKLPMNNLSILTALTNAEHIKDALAHPTILVGGETRGKTKSIVGSLAEASFKAMGIRPDMAIIAATELNHMGEFSSSDVRESRLKAMMLGPRLFSSIRALVVDSTKILSMKGLPWPFATFDTIDLIVTDSGVSTLASALKAIKPSRLAELKLNPDLIEKHFHAFWKLVANHSKPVLIGRDFYLKPEEPFSDQMKENYSI